MVNELSTIDAHQLTLEHKIAIWLHSKQGHSGSASTERTYSQAIEHFRSTLQSVGLDLNGDRATLQTIVQGWASLSWRPELAAQGIQVENATFNKRLAAISSFYEFGIDRGWFLTNPTRGIERRKTELYSGAQQIPADDVAAALANIDRSTLMGERDYVLLTLGFSTGRRAMELAGLRAGDIQFIGPKRMKIFWRRIKGGKSHTDTIEDQELIDLMRGYLTRLYGSIQNIAKDAPLWPRCKNDKCKPVGYETLRNICKERLGTTEVQTLRHTFTALMGEAGATLQEKQAALLHENINTTLYYDRRLHGQVNKHIESISHRIIKNG